MIFDSDLHSSAAPAYALQTTRSLALTSAAGHDYTLYVAWPNGVAPAGGWPVVYMLDGETFGIAREILRYQAGGGADPLTTPRVLVGIAYPGPSRRVIDYSPPEADKPQAFRRFLLDEVCPLIQRTFEVDAGQQTLMGHSLGGLFVLETMFEQFDQASRGVFRRYVASSPSVWWRDGHLPRVAREFIDGTTVARQAAPAPCPTGQNVIRLLLSAAQYDGELSPAEHALPPNERDMLAHTRRTRRMVEGNQEMADALARVPGLSVDFRVFEGETHRSVWPRAIAHALLDD